MTTQQGGDGAEVMQGVEFTTRGDDAPGPADAELTRRPVLFTATERGILELYDRLETLQLEIALLKVKGVLSAPSSAPTAVSESDIAAAQQALLEAKAAYTVRNSVIGSVLVAAPILKAVHGGQEEEEEASSSALDDKPSNTTIEQDLLPLLTRRDALSLSLTSTAAQLATTRTTLLTVESDSQTLAAANSRLAAELLALAAAGDADRRSAAESASPHRQAELVAARAQLRLSRQKWRIIKGTVGGVVVGSGVDWARDPDLLALVADEDDEGDGEGEGKEEEERDDMG